MDQRLFELREIKDLFERRITDLNGEMRDVVDFKGQTFARGVLNLKREIRRGDAFQAGVALRADTECVEVKPFLFRLVCQNGAIMALSGSCEKIYAEDTDAASRLELVDDAILRCASAKIFDQSLGQTAKTLGLRLDHEIMMYVMMASHRHAGIRAAVLQGLRRPGETDGYALMNAVTAVARDSTDPEQKWRLEEIGGSIPAIVENPERSRTFANPLPFDVSWTEEEKLELCVS